ncbi:MAG TPA: choice-of-anchor J domain-containing protein [Candidatus Avibacteroides faecavium]|nr:choice-of-anchor J domain-containing protein [Candidatus Avibacteroides faecavium]
MKLKSYFPLLMLAAACGLAASCSDDDEVFIDDGGTPPPSSLPVTPPVVGADVLFTCDFQATTDADKWVTWDVDGLTPSNSMLTVGFEAGTPWLFRLRDSYLTTNYYAGSTSSYNPAGQADDWLVTKDAIAVPDSGYVLAWNSQALDLTLRDGLKVFVSTTGNNPEDFTDAPVFEVEEEEAGATENADGEWASHAVSLNAYAGQSIYVAFVNQSNDKSIILLDDVLVSLKRYVSLQSLVVDRTTEGEVTVSGVVTALDEEVRGFNAYFMVDSLNQFGQAFPDVVLQPGEGYTFTLDVPMELAPAGDYTDYQLWVDCNGVSEVLAGSVAHLAFEPMHKVVIEEGTGQWCGYCPMGILSFEYLKEIYPDQFIGIAVHNNDNMMVDEYDAGLHFSQFPLGYANRAVTCQPMTGNYELTGADTFHDAFVSELAKIPEAEVRLADVSMDADSVVSMTSNVRFAMSAESDDYRLAYVVMSNGYVAPGSQANYLYSADYETFGKFGKDGEWGQQYFEGYPYDDVACCIEPSFGGATGVIPASPVPGETYTHDFSIDLTQCSNIAEGVGLELVVMLIDGADGSIVNADKYVIAE